MNAYKRFFYNSESFFLLRTTGWIVGLATGILFAVFSGFFLSIEVAITFPYVAILASIISDFYLFAIKRLKESAFKNPEILLKHMDDIKRIDKYAIVMTWIKPVVLVLLTWFMASTDISKDGATTVMFMSALPYPIIVGMFISARVAIITKAMRPEELSKNTMPRHYGTPGLDSQGVYAGSIPVSMNKPNQPHH